MLLRHRWQVVGREQRGTEMLHVKGSKDFSPHRDRDQERLAAVRPALHRLDQLASPTVIRIEQGDDEPGERIAGVDFKHCLEEIAYCSRCAMTEQGDRGVIAQAGMPRTHS